MMLSSPYPGCGNIMTMPSLPKVPAAEKIDIESDSLRTCEFDALDHPRNLAVVPRASVLGSRCPRTVIEYACACQGSEGLGCFDP